MFRGLISSAKSAVSLERYDFDLELARSDVAATLFVIVGAGVASGLAGLSMALRRYRHRC
jgi:hypothetical protein